ncbi:MAG: alpha/beta fold hydrolase [Clostridia bacterium]|nr:alpha/beta fold hydrolase [Clostridia bacterium]
MEIALWILLAILVFGILPTFMMSFFIYRALLLRTSKDIWDRDPSMPDDEEYVGLYKQATEWGKQWSAFKKDVEIKNEGLRLYGEYFDFGSDRAVIILPGRMEACTYSYHYGEPYRKAGWNVLTIDNRAHGRSDGKVNSLGYKEYRDVIAWAKLLHDEYGIRSVVLHGICIGASCALFAAASKNCPDYIAGIVGDGMYQCFYDSCKNHMVKDKRPIYPFLMETMLWIRLISGANAVTDGPKKRIYDMYKPILFIHSREDLFSTPEKVQQLYDRCPSEHKKLVWFDRGGHSRVRYNNPELYDQTVSDFLATL